MKRTSLQPGARMRTHTLRAFFFIQTGTYQGKERKESVLSITEVHFINDMLLHYCVIDNQDLQVDHSIR